MSFKRKNTRNEYIFKNSFKLTYLHVIKHEIEVILPTKTKINSVILSNQH